MRIYFGIDVLVVNVFDLMIDDGEFFVMVGLLGFGKMMVLWMFVGFEEVDVGVIFIGDDVG